MIEEVRVRSPVMGDRYALRPGYGRSYERGYAPRPQSEACQAFLNETQGVHRELHDKRFEYREAIRNPKTTPETLSSIDKQIVDLRWKIQAKNTQGCWW